MHLSGRVTGNGHQHISVLLINSGLLHLLILVTVQAVKCLCLLLQTVRNNRLHFLCICGTVKLEAAQLIGTTPCLGNPHALAFHHARCYRIIFLYRRGWHLRILILISQLIHYFFRQYICPGLMLRFMQRLKCMHAGQHDDHSQRYS